MKHCVIVLILNLKLAVVSLAVPISKTKNIWVYYDSNKSTKLIKCYTNAKIPYSAWHHTLQNSSFNHN